MIIGFGDKLKETFSRRESTTLVICINCKKSFLGKNAIHGYNQVGVDDVEPADFCPFCLEEIE